MGKWELVERYERPNEARAAMMRPVSKPNETVEKGLREIGVADGW